MGSNQTTIVYYETGRREPRISYLIDLMKLTGVTGEWLLTGKGGMYGDEPKEITKEEAIEALFGDKADEFRLSENSKIVVFNDRIVTGGGTPPLP